MIVEPQKPLFQPVSIKLIFETQEELDAVGCMFNSGRITYALDRVDPKKTVNWYTIYKAFKTLGACFHKTMMFNKALKEE